MEKLQTKIPEILILKSHIYFDSRGFFTEVLNIEDLKKIGLKFDIVQVNHSYNEQVGTLRGLHFQTKPFEQSKIVTCIKGAIFDVAVDIRPYSPNFLNFQCFLIVSHNSNFDPKNFDFPIQYDYLIQYPDKLLIPRGFAHGYLTLLPSTEVLYFTDNKYSREHDRVILYDDPQINIPWPKVVDNFIVSDKDRNAPLVSSLNNELEL
ncbi:MAG: dTDP-4-dehydrorhamnose 3,5-epimerase family protein [Candidatus Kapaibacteriota bacterium]